MALKEEDTLEPTEKSYKGEEKNVINMNTHSLGCYHFLRRTLPMLRQPDRFVEN